MRGSPDGVRGFVNAANISSLEAAPSSPDPGPDAADALPGSNTPSTTCMTDVHVVTSGTSTAALVAALHSTTHSLLVTGPICRKRRTESRRAFDTAF